MHEKRGRKRQKLRIQPKVAIRWSYTTWPIDIWGQGVSKQPPPAEHGRTVSGEEEEAKKNPKNIIVVNAE